MAIINWLVGFFRSQTTTPETLRLLICPVHGNHYYSGLDLVKQGKVFKGENLKLVREPSNEHDEDAIEVFTRDRKKIGYVPKNNNTVIATLMDQGCECTAIIECIEPDAWLPITIRIELRVK